MAYSNDPCDPGQEPQCPPKVVVQTECGPREVPLPDVDPEQVAEIANQVIDDQLQPGGKIDTWLDDQLEPGGKIDEWVDDQLEPGGSINNWLDDQLQEGGSIGEALEEVEGSVTVVRDKVDRLYQDVDYTEAYRESTIVTMGLEGVCQGAPFVVNFEYELVTKIGLEAPSTPGEDPLRMTLTFSNE